ncbi:MULTISPECIES: hypothetical protein [Tatumella]|uniref:Lipoprotein n=2 Tax=Tatumella ptyseos TaxID=82987 RepID=A0A085JQI2_9GAMM|nr:MULTISPECIES: hypothetical protein [Tatumella]KFD22728.1 hypothetical protein GTPT_0307 [Tatumella ptyseos ATCC 33301]SQK71852.1 Uncharacterised protein [Tatumella ptyseos]
MRLFGLLLLSVMLLTACASKKEKPQETKVVHTGDCSASGKIVNCQWQSVPNSNMH